MGLDWAGSMPGAMMGLNWANSMKGTTMGSNCIKFETALGQERWGLTGPIL